MRTLIVSSVAVALIIAPAADAQQARGHSPSRATQHAAGKPEVTPEYVAKRKATVARNEAKLAHRGEVKAKIAALRSSQSEAIQQRLAAALGKAQGAPAPSAQQHPAGADLARRLRAAQGQQQGGPQQSASDAAAPSRAKGLRIQQMLQKKQAKIQDLRSRVQGHGAAGARGGKGQAKAQAAPKTRAGARKPARGPSRAAPKMKAGANAGASRGGRQR